MIPTHNFLASVIHVQIPLIVSAQLCVNQNPDKIHGLYLLKFHISYFVIASPTCIYLIASWGLTWCPSADFSVNWC